MPLPAAYKPMSILADFCRSCGKSGKHFAVIRATHVCWLQIMLRRRLILERFDDRTVSKLCSLPRRIEISRYRQDHHIQKRTLFKPNDCVVHPEAHELLKFLMEFSINPILFISFSVHHGPLVR